MFWKQNQQNDTYKGIKRKQETGEEISSAGSIAIHFQAHQPDCFVCAAVNKTKLLLLRIFSSRLENYQPTYHRIF
jgi:hypothetical protein